ncbi:hypothetical protein HANVADRAFT_757 [Hanseniaspora valbyensis NRRL Y-1626]|uniref:Large ribosomal subunit protein eL24-related N-terminal domain-containing protein n=1 Tax=Hanseniaspora valbyensis NRRL Y-1626 TaxID=766949 RepID=A0A1B7TIR8_9ASCO|nr:hypothetical protein HANVADRAFT_757 [Hanseniaspora valbyensis NRRL Y-1626]
MKVEIDSFSGSKIYPGRGTLFIRGDSKIFQIPKLQNPRRISWTVLYRRHHKKGITEEVSKKRARKQVKNQRPIVGASLEFIQKKRALKPEVRKQERDAKIKVDKEKKKADKASRKAAAAASGKTFSKQQAKGAFVKVAATSR